jgi:hypothetical protein
VVTHDVIEYTVESPPKNMVEAIPLAIEQYLYCGDIVDQGIGSVSNLASSLIDSHRWYFWWD